VLAQADDEALHRLYRQLQKATEIVKVAKKGKKKKMNEEVHLEVIRATDY
jgi:acetolactate synthase small subunit